MADKRKGYKHGKFVRAEPNPHVDIQKYKTKDGKDDGKRYKVEDSEMKVSKKKKKGQGLLGGPSPSFLESLPSSGKKQKLALRGGGRAYGKNS